MIERQVSFAQRQDSVRERMSGSEARIFTAKSDGLCRLHQRSQCVVAVAAGISDGKGIKLSFGNFQHRTDERKKIQNMFSRGCGQTTAETQRRKPAPAAGS